MVSVEKPFTPITFGVPSESPQRRFSGVLRAMGFAHRLFQWFILRA